ncbi:MAG: type II toxin-antitoxin system HipA family toxin [Rhodospirillaceae bacterium]
MSEIYVFIDLSGKTHRVGTLRVIAKGMRTSSTFQYDDKWLVSSERISLEPALMVSKGIFTPPVGREMFSSIGDSAPDTWGRRLMQKRERRAAKNEGRTVRTLTEADYLLGVADVARLGALRFRRSGDIEFQCPLEKSRTIPPLVELPRLLSVTEKVLRNEETEDDLLLLFAPGSSLGGVRPKSSVINRQDQLLIAKFPKEDDDYNVGAWEEVALTLANMAGITVAEHAIERIVDKTVLLSKRFDRNQSGRRIPFLSAMAMLGMKDGDRGSYPELVDGVRTHGSDVDADVIELYRRMVFNILSSNVDDHLRNHGFLWSGELGWRLSPAYDLNPVPADVRPHILSTNISLDEGTCSIELARETAEYFNLSLEVADTIISEVAQAVSNWRKVAASVNLKPSEIERMESAFEHDELTAARKRSLPRKQTKCKKTP